MADGQGPFTPEIAGQLANSPMIQDDSVREQLTSIAAPLINEPQEVPMAAQEQVPESREEFIEGLTEVPISIDPAIEKKAQEQVAPTPESLSRADREKLVADKARESMIQRINNGEVSEADAMKFLRADAQMQQTEEQKIEDLDAAKVDGQQQIIQEKYDQYLEKKAATDEFNRIAEKTDGLIAKPEPNILEFLDEKQLSFAAQSGMDIPPAAAYKAEKELEQLDLAKETEKQAAGQRTLAAQQEASQKVAKEQQEVQQQKAQIAQQEIEKEDEELRRDFTSLSEVFSEGTTGQKIGTAIAIALGGLAQGMMGGNINPVLNVLDKEFERNDAKKQRALQLISQNLKAKEQSTKDLTAKLKLRELTGKVELQERQIAAKRQFDKLVAQGGSVPESLLTSVGADRESRERIVRGLDGKAYIADSKEAATELRKQKNETEPAINTVDELLDFVGNINKLDPRDRAAVASKLQATVGKLRIPLTGPGVLTDTEYERLLNTLGNPAKLFTLDSIEAAKLRAVRDVLQNDINIRYRNAGVKLPMTRKEKVTQQIMQNPKISNKARALELARKKNWM